MSHNLGGLYQEGYPEGVLLLQEAYHKDTQERQDQVVHQELDAELAEALLKYSVGYPPPQA